MKTRFCAALLLAAFCVTLFTGCASVNALNRQVPAPEILIPQEPAPLAPAPVEVPTQSATTEPGQITKEEAVSIALKHANLTEDQVTRLHTEFGYDDGRPEYDVDFHYGGWEYDYEIHAVTGDILRSECEPAEPVPTKPAKTDPPTTDPAPVSSQPAADRLTKEQARDIALKHAGLSVNDVTRLRVEFDYDGGRPEYEVDFRHDGYEYDYEIHAETGRIITWDKDRDD